MRLSDIGTWSGRVTAAMLALWCAASVAQTAPDKSDVRVLIDISGSMRQNDPNNLRRPALRMLAGLLQPGTQAGVWTFARWTNNLVAVGDVDAAWKKRTQSLSEQISSPGQFTNIEEVLDKASADWSGEPTTHARHLVLLTDGMVDVSRQEAENAQSRERIIGTLLPRLKSAGVKVHTIALSERADHALMKILAGETGGWYQQVAQADELQRVFLRMFETVGKPDSVPLQDNRFVVDSSISEATVLVFSRPDTPPVVLRSPSGDEYTDSDLPAGVAWFRDQGYDLITVASPQKGEWSLQADIDPDNRVMIVTDLKLQHSEVPTHIAVGESLRIEANLSSRGELVTRQAFLRLLQVYAERIDQGASAPLALNDQGEGADDKAADGRYTLRHSEPAAQDEVGVLVAVESPTFMREKRFRLAVHEPVEGSVADGPDGPELSVRLQGAVMQPGAELSAWQQAADGQRGHALARTRLADDAQHLVGVYVEVDAAHRRHRTAGTDEGHGQAAHRQQRFARPLRGDRTAVRGRDVDLAGHGRRRRRHAQVNAARWYERPACCRSRARCRPPWARPRSGRCRRYWSGSRTPTRPAPCSGCRTRA